MALKIYFACFCTLAVLLIRLNDGAPTKSTTAKSGITKLTTAKSVTTKIVSPAKPMLIGGHTAWETKIKPKHKKIFDDYKKITLNKLQALHNVSKTFNLKPEKFATQVVGGINYLYLVKLPTNKYAFVSIHHRIWEKSHYGREDNVHIRPQTYELNDKSV